jgi:signal transduction histidine kinase
MTVALPVSSQSSLPLDSLLIQLKGGTDAANRGVLLNKISYAYYSYKLDSAIYYAKLAEEEGITHSDTAVISRALNLQGAAAASAGNIREAIRKTEQSLNLALAINDSVNIANASNNLALIDMDSGDTEQALKRFQQSLDHTTTDTLGRIYTFRNIALLYNRSGNMEASDKYMNQALQEAQASKDPKILQMVFYTEGKLAMEDSTQLDSAIIFFGKAIAISRKYKDVLSEIQALINVGVIHGNAGRQERSRQVFRKVVELSEKKQYPFGAFYGQMGVATSYLEDKNFEKAQEAIQQIEINHPLSLADRLAYHELLGQFFRETDRFQQALAEQDSVFFYKDSLASTRRQQELARLEVKYELGQKNRENEILALEKEQAEQRALSQKRLGLFVLFVLLILLTTSLYLLWQRRRFNLRLKEQVNLQTEKLRKTNNELKRSNQELERFTYIASHDMKEPLRNIISFSMLLERKKELWEGHQDAADFFGHIKRSARQMHTLIQDVLAYAQVRGGRETDPLVSVDLNAVFSQIREALEPQLKEKNATLLGENLTFIVGTPHHFYIILKNLVENGLKYNESKEPMITVRQELQANTTQLLVIDNGIGIPDEFKPKVFDMFYRLHGRTQYEGTGLGLAIVDRLAQSLEATIEISDRPGGGTVFAIQFPD